MFQNEGFTLSLSFNLPHPISTTTTTAKSLKTSIEGEVFFNLNLNSGMKGNTKRYLLLQTVTENNKRINISSYAIPTRAL